MPLLTPEMMRALLADGDKLSEMLGANYRPAFPWKLSLEPTVFYYEACDRMVTIEKPIAGFNPRPWRADVFRFSRKGP